MSTYKPGLIGYVEVRNLAAQVCFLCRTSPTRRLTRLQLTDVEQAGKDYVLVYADNVLCGREFLEFVHCLR